MASAANFCKMAIKSAVAILSIKFPQYPSIGAKFQEICIEEAYEEIDVLIEDFGAGFEESVILETISDETPIKDTDKEPLCNTIHYTLTTFSPPPAKLSLADINMKVDKKEMEDMTAMVIEQANQLKPKDTKDLTLIKLLVIGDKHRFPLLTYLIDLYIRLKIIKYQELYEKLDQKDTMSRRTKFVAKRFRNVMDIPAFFTQCYAMKILKHKADNKSRSAENALMWYKSSMESFFRRLYGPLKMEPQQMNYKINDNITTYARYYLSILITVNNIISHPNAKLPLQIDFWVIPKAIKQEVLNEVDEKDDDSCDDSDYDDNQENNNILNINNLQQRLKSVNNVITKNITNDELPRTFFKVYEDVVKGERSKRMVMIIDRRKDGKDRIENETNYGTYKDENKEGDKLYGFLPTNSCNIPSGRYLNESLFNLSKIEVLPTDNDILPPEEGNTAIHASSDLSNMFLFSIHIHEANVVRAYWYINGSAARFYVNDMIDVWPLYFIEKSIDKRTGRVHYQDVEKVKELIAGKKQNLPLRDSTFDKFFFKNTGVTLGEIRTYNKLRRNSKAQGNKTTTVPLKSGK